MPDRKNERILELSQKVDFLCEIIIKAQRYAESDPETALMQARKSAEAICRNVFSAEIGEPGKIMLDGLIKKLAQKNMLPQKIVIPLGTIQAYGNYASHAQSDYEKMDFGYISPCLSALAQITDWYFSEYLGIETPSEIKEKAYGAKEKRKGSEDPDGHKGRGVLKQQKRQMAPATCPECNEPVEHDWELCPYCEAQIKLVCRQCEREVKKQWKICPFCKSRLVEAVEKRRLKEETARDAGYILYANGIVEDTKTGLEWMVGPDKDTNWDEAKSWAQNLDHDGGGWRMPTMNELESIYEEGKGDRNMTPFLKTSGWNVWSGETQGSSGARIFNFNSGSRYWRNHDYSGSIRAFAVRSRGDG